MIRSRVRGVLILGCLAMATAGALFACSDDDPGGATPTADAGQDGDGTKTDSGTDCPPIAPASCSLATCTKDLGEPAACVANTCVKLKSLDCQRVGGALDADNVVLIGELLAQNGANAASGISRINSVELAINEVNAAGGIPASDRCQPARKLAYIACDDANLAGDAGAGDAGDGGVAAAIDRVRAGKHLTDDLKVPVIIGGSTSGNTLEIARLVTMPAKVMQFAPSSTAISITAPTDFNASPDGTRLLWRAAPSDVAQSVALQKIYADLEAAAKAGGVASPKLALVTKNDAYGKGIAAAFKQGLMVNGQAIPNANFVDIVYKTTPADADGVLRADAVDQLVTFAPNIIVMAGTSEATDDIVRPYESVARAVAPVYLMADGQKKPELAQLVDPADARTPKAADPVGLRKRIRGTQPGVVTPLAQRFFNFGYKTAYGNQSVLAYGMAGSYDIAYLLTYAIAATNGGPIDGTTLAKNMALLTGGTQAIDVGPAGLPKGFEAMRKGEKVDFNGASGPLDFDVATGEAPSDYSVWCVKIDPNTSKAIFEEATGLSYSAKDQKLVGTYTCQ